MKNIIAALISLCIAVPAVAEQSDTKWFMVSADDPHECVVANRTPQEDANDHRKIPGAVVKLTVTPSPSDGGTVDFVRITVNGIATNHAYQSSAKTCETFRRFLIDQGVISDDH